LPAVADLDRRFAIDRARLRVPGAKVQDPILKDFSVQDFLDVWLEKITPTYKVNLRVRQYSSDDATIAEQAAQTVVSATTPDGNVRGFTVTKTSPQRGEVFLRQDATATKQTSRRDVSPASLARWVCAPWRQGPTAR
jgi:hypothetical protein